MSFYGGPVGHYNRSSRSNHTNNSNDPPRTNATHQSNSHNENNTRISFNEPTHQEHHNRSHAREQHSTTHNKSDARQLSSNSVKTKSEQHEKSSQSGQAHNYKSKSALPGESSKPESTFTASTAENLSTNVASEPITDQADEAPHDQTLLPNLLTTVCCISRLSI